VHAVLAPSIDWTRTLLRPAGLLRPADWSQVFIAPMGWGRTALLCRRHGWSDAATALEMGEAVVQIPELVSAEEVERLVSVSKSIASEEREACTDGAVRIHVPTRLASSDVALCDSLLSRMMRFVDDEFPELVSFLFGTTPGGLSGLFASDGLVFSETEPALNVYFEDGCFLPHEDNCALTVLIPLTSPADGSGGGFVGGGTGFWAPEVRREAAERPDDDFEAEPSVVLAPSAGTAMLFAGHVTHAGMQVETGSRVVLVASFSRKWNVLGVQQRAECFPSFTFGARAGKSTE